MSEKVYLREKEVEALGGPKRPTLEKYRRLGIGPEYLKVGKMVLYPRESFLAWLESHRVKTGDAA